MNKFDNKIKVSVILPCYNVEDYINKCLDSVLGQSLSEIEVICVDDGSKDKTLKIIRSYAKNDKRVVVVTQENKGAGPARNNGIDHARGEFIAFMDPDDFYPTQNTLMNMYLAAVNNNVLISGGSLLQLKGEEIINDPTQFESGYTFKKEGLVSYSDYQFDYGYWRFLYNSKFLKDNQIYFPDYRRQQDPPFMVKAFGLAKTFYALVEPTYVYRLSHKSVEWNERKSHDLFCGVYDVIQYSIEFGLFDLYKNVMNRMNCWTYRTACASMLKYSSVKNQVLKLLELQKSTPWFNELEDFVYDDIFNAIEKGRESDTVVSLVVPVYNVEKYLARCMDSLVAQSFPWMEILCVNDGATDNSRKILEKYAAIDSRVKILDKVNGGLSSARNYGLEHASCDYIMFIDSDDWIDLDTVEKAVAKMSGPIDIVAWGAELVADGVDPKCENMIVGQEYHRIKITGQKDITDDIISRCSYTVWNKLLKTKILRDYGITFAEGKLFEDNDFVINYLIHCCTGYFLDEYLYHYSQRPNSIMERVRNRKSDKTGDHLYIFDNIYTHFEKYGLLDEHRKIIADRFSLHLKSAYIYAPDDKKNDIRKLATQFAKKYNPELFYDNVIENLVEENYSAVREVNDLIVSLTSYPARISTVHLTVKSLLSQTKPANKIILWLADSQFPKREKSLPAELLKLVSIKFEIRWCDDIRSYKKLIPTLELYPDSYVITADDDIVYPRDMISCLWNEHTKFDNTVICHRGYKVEINEDKVLPYSEWKMNFHSDPSCLIFPTGVAGVLYPPHCLHENVMNREEFMSLAPHGDDIWFWANAILNGTNICLAEKNISKLNLIDGTQETAMWHDNLTSGRNDVQIDAVLKAYPSILKKLISSYPKFEIDAYRKENEKLKNELNKNNQIVSGLKYKNMLRVDMYNYGTEKNSLEISSKEMNTKLFTSSKWMNQSNRQGRQLQSDLGRACFTVKIIESGLFVLDLRGVDFKDSSGKRMKLEVGISKLYINGLDVLNNIHVVWHDEPYVYKKKVLNGETIDIEIEWVSSEVAKDWVIAQLSSLLSDKSDNFVSVHDLENARENAVKLSDMLTQSKYEIVLLQQKMHEINSMLIKNSKYLDEVKESTAWKTGRCITWVPRKIKTLIRLYKKNGFAEIKKYLSK